MSIARIKGFADMLPPRSDQFTRMENCARDIFSRYGFVELRTPLLEFTELFQRSIGEETDVVQKEMYTFPDRKGRSLTLRPEATAGVMRAYIEAGLANREAVSRLFTTGPMFRYERPQKGRMRQFHQINCECLGSQSPLADAELIIMLMRFLRALGLGELTLKLNSLGCAECRPRFKEALLNYLRGVDRHALCPDCARRVESNPLRVLDCKQPGCRALTDNAPRLADYNCPDCKAHFETVLSMLRAEELPLELDHRLVRGLDYYCRTTFEVVSGSIGAQSAVAGGGRYDGLIRSLGGPDAPGVGFACGMERLALLLGDSAEQRPDFYLLGMEEGGRMQAFALAQKLRAAGLRGEMNFSAGGFKSLMRQAGKSGARCCLIIGPDEVARGDVSIKHLDSGEQRSLPQADAILYLKQTGTAND
ncbi:histidine--tRNA ligase [uncultured Desulfovibrio sp.]|uniref:histidine--tRNA ligase n=1 Tax=uncultured Desulfovibrio sp. TaxID=167968 RepID=UPI00261E8022|nr:histidine--tRNA ligase [uncultured Desulfovibrio sp.]